VVVVGSVSAPGLAILSDSWSDSEKTSRSFVGEVMDWTALWMAVMLIAVLAAPLVICARVGLLVESFISLRKVPSGAYAVVPVGREYSAFLGVRYWCLRMYMLVDLVVSKCT